VLAFFESSFGARSLSSQVYNIGVQTYSMGGLTSVVAMQSTRTTSRSDAEAPIG